MACLKNCYPGAACFHFTTAVSTTCPTFCFCPEALITDLDEEAHLP